ncbi:MAG: AAA family ATPase [Candidatus Cloacimonadaceae bacterium]|nr:AAA family ATPase [Candidatus Cloacimonadaceae bacterium]
MISKINFIDNTGLFLKMNGAANIPLKRLSLVYAENGRGKTTLSAILRSLMTGDPIHINERRSIGSQSDPHVVLTFEGNQTVQFQNGSWSRSIPEIVIYDDVFVTNNVCSGLMVDPSHRQNLHELIIGEQGVRLNQQLNEYIEQIEAHNRELQRLASQIPGDARCGFSVDDFCSLPIEDDIDSKILAAERDLLVAQNALEISNAALFTPIQLPEFDQSAFSDLFAASLDTLDSTALLLVKDHFEKYSPSPELWISQGMSLLQSTPEEKNDNTCPFCSQPLEGSKILQNYRAYFSEAYKQLIKNISESVSHLNNQCGEDKLVAFERAIRSYNENRQYWSKFTDIPEIAFESESVIQSWKNLREMIYSKLMIKQSAPLEIVSFTEAELAMFSDYEANRQRVVDHNLQVAQINIEINAIKQRPESAEPTLLVRDLNRLKAIKSRYSQELSQFSEAYLQEKANKQDTEGLRTTARINLENYRNSVFPRFEAAVNDFLQIFNAGFRLSSVSPTNIRTGSSCNYNVLINNTPVSITSNHGSPAFHNTLSSGDRNSLALAFFLATLRDDPNIGNKIVIIDDPASTLDDHRTLSTAQEIRRLAGQAKQVIVLSHSKSFLCSIWTGADRSDSASLQIVRDGNNSTITDWNVDSDSYTEHDRLFGLLDAFINGERVNPRDVAIAIRPYLEGFLRVRCPKYFVPGTLLGPFINICRHWIGTQEQTLNEQQTNELENIKEYANRFHHDTNPQWQTANVNDGELNGFVRRTIAFASI